MEQEKNAPSDPAPALTRGLRLLDLLALDGQASLELLARKTGWPKSSVMRYLHALQAAGAARQDPESKAWSALLALKRLAAARSQPLELASRRLAPLALQTGHCAELYDTRAGKLELVDRAEPEFEEHALVARVGYVRDLEELDATAALFFAYQEFELPAGHRWQWSAGRKRAISSSGARRALREARENGYAIDRDFNSNGIRRFATSLLDDNTRLVGVLAIAQRQTPKAEAETDIIVSALLNATEQVFTSFALL